MRKILATVCLLGSTLALSACDTAEMGHVDTAPPYNRTADYDSAYEPMATPTDVAPATHVFHEAQTK